VNDRISHASRQESRCRILQTGTNGRPFVPFARFSIHKRNGHHRQPPGYVVLGYAGHSGIRSSQWQRGLGPLLVASIVNTIGASSYWPNTAIFVTWDEWGGLYDHVAPPTLFFHGSELGFRVPLLVISLYAKQGYVFPCST